MIKKNVSIFDLDNTLAILNRKIWEFDKLSLDKLNKRVYKEYLFYKGRGYETHILSARPTKYKSLSKKWLENHNIEYDRITLKGIVYDSLSSFEFKREYLLWAKNKYNEVVVIDDLDKIERLCNIMKINYIKPKQ